MKKEKFTLDVEIEASASETAKGISEVAIARAKFNKVMNKLAWQEMPVMREIK